MEIQISTGDYDIIGSGTIVGIFDSPITFVISSSLTYIIEFKNDTVSPITRIEKKPINDKSLKLEFINFNNTLGQGTSAPLSIGNFNNRKLFLNYRIYFLTENSGKTVHYTFLLEKEVKNG